MLRNIDKKKRDMIQEIQINDFLALQSKGATSECTMHQLAPYIGKLRPNLIRELIKLYTKPGDTILDPFAGAGTVSVESLLLGRNAIANDINPYAITLINAKISPPNSLEEALNKARYYLAYLKKETGGFSICETPDWVKKFFHPATLREVTILSKLFREHEEHFLLACLLGILHHQRPGFLSYPSSHMVPYLRTKKYPKQDFPDLYTYREVGPRLMMKIERAFRRFSNYDSALERKCFKEDATNLRFLNNTIDAVITSPPYMNTLDYGRDNRLRLWFLGIENYKYYDNKNPSSIQDFEILLERTLKNLKYALKKDSYCIFILGDVLKSSNPMSSIFQEIALDRVGGFRAVRLVEDRIPDVRRARKNGKKITLEWINVLQREN